MALAEELDCTPSTPRIGPFDWAKEGKERSGARIALLAGTGLILVLQFADWLTTRALLGRGLTELNPVASALIAIGWLLAAKSGLAATLAWRVTRKTTHTYALVCVVYLVAGTYLAVALGNLFGLLRG